MSKTICSEILAALPPDCPVRVACNSIHDVCSRLPENDHPQPCHGDYCTCEVALDGGRVDIIDRKVFDDA